MVAWATSPPERPSWGMMWQDPLSCIYPEHEAVLGGLERRKGDGRGWVSLREELVPSSRTQGAEPGPRKEKRNKTRQLCQVRAVRGAVLTEGGIPT